MTTTYNSIPHANAFDVLRNGHGHGVILSEYETARIATALEGISTIAAVLQQRELDAELGGSNGLTFGPNVAMGLLAAAATCAEFANDLVDTGGPLGARAEHGTKAHDHLSAARMAMQQANRQEGGQ